MNASKNLLFVNKKKQKNFIHSFSRRHPERSEGSTLSSFLADAGASLRPRAGGADTPSPP